jgi:hypothetical protein
MNGLDSGPKEKIMRHIVTLMALSMAVLVVDISTASAQYRSRGGRNVTTYSVGVGGLGLNFGQTYYSQPYYNNNGYSGLSASYPWNSFGQYYSSPSYYGQNQSYYPSPRYYGGQSNFYYPRYQSQFNRGYQQRYYR